jgi:tetratricopeptide (TPR) repeat protein
MAKFSLRRIISRFTAKPPQIHDPGDFWALYNKGAYQEAYAALNDFMLKRPQSFNNGDLCILLADLELRVNDDASRAQQLLDRAREVGHSVVDYYHNVNGNVMLTAGKYEKAVQDFEQSVIIDPSVPNLTTFAQALSISNDARAMNVWKQVLAKDPNNCFAHICIGFEAAKAGDRAKALLMAKRADNLGPSARDLSGIGRLYLEIDEFQSAINAYLEAERRGYEPKGPLYAAIAACYFALGDNKTGRKYAEWAVGFNPENDYVKEVWQYSEELRREKQ